MGNSWGIEKITGDQMGHNIYNSNEQLGYNIDNNREQWGYRIDNYGEV